MKKILLLMSTFFIFSSLTAAALESEKPLIQQAIETEINNLIAPNSLPERTEEDSRKLEAISYLYRLVHGVSLSFYPFKDADQKLAIERLTKLGLILPDGTIHQFAREYIKSNVKYEQREFAYPVLKNTNCSSSQFVW